MSTGIGIYSWIVYYWISDYCFCQGQINVSQIGDIRKLSVTDFWNISIIITDQGDNHYVVVKQTPENIVFYSENVDRASRKTKLIFVVGKNGSGSLK